MNRTFASSIDKNHIGQNLTFVGWLEDFRDMGKIGFISVRDMTGNFQGVLLESCYQVLGKYQGKVLSW